MKTRRLSEIDLARIAVLAPDEQRHRLRKLKVGYPPHTYHPLRNCVPDIANMHGDLLRVLPRTPWDKIEARLREDSKSANEFDFNRAVALALHDHLRGINAQSRRKQIARWNAGYGQSVAYWWNLFLVIDDRAWFPFIDPRVTAPLTRAARRFTFSIMHERIRAAEPDFANAGLLIFQFGKFGDGERSVQPHRICIRTTNLTR